MGEMIVYSLSLGIERSSPLPLVTPNLVLLITNFCRLTSAALLVLLDAISLL